MKKILTTLLCLVFAFTACEDEFSSSYSTKYRVRFYFEVNQSAEMIGAIGNPGQYVTIRQKSGNSTTQKGVYIRIENLLGGNDYALSYIGANEFELGLGGLIVGTSSTPNMNDGFDILAYDLACPNCDRIDRRLTLKDNGLTKCAKCGLTYDLNNLGVIYKAEDTNKKDKVRGLYRYRIVYNGTSINVFN